MKKENIDWQYWLTRFVFVLAILLTYKFITNYAIFLATFRNFIGVLSPFILGFLLAYLLDGFQKKAEELFQKIGTKTKLTFFLKASRGLSVLFIYICLFFLLFLTLNYVIPLIVNNVIDLINLLPGFYNYLVDMIEKLQQQGIFENLQLQDILQKFTGEFSPEKMLSQWAQALSSIGMITKGLSSFVFNLFLTLIISIYTLLLKDSILVFCDKVAKKIFSDCLYKNSKHWLQTTSTVFYKFLSSQFLDACIIGFSTTLLLWILNVKFALTLGILLGICNMIPYFGAIFASVVTGMITFFTGGLSKAISALLALVILQQIDGNIIGPRIMSGALDLNPIIVIISISIGGAYFGVLGMFLAVPVAAILKIILTKWLEDSPQTNED